MTTALRHLGRLVATFLVAATLIAAPSARPAFAATEVDSYLVDARVVEDGSLQVKATLTPRGGAGEVSQRFATTLPGTGSEQYAFTLRDVRASKNGADAGAKVTQEGAYQQVTIPVTDETPVVLEYVVDGAAFPTDGETTTVVWRLLQGLNLPVRTFEATVAVPAPFTMIDCAAGAPGAPGACTWYQGGTHDTEIPTFHDGPRGAGEVVQVELRFADTAVAPNAKLTHRWSLDRAFSLGWIPLAVAGALGLLGLAALWGLRRHYLRDSVQDATPSVVGSFRPVAAGQSEFVMTDDIRPGEVGTLVDGTVDPVDVAATILDLAVHGSLRIRELPRPTPFTRADWEFERLPGGRALMEYEQTILDAVAPLEGDRVRVSQLHDRIEPVLPQVQRELYDEVVERGWFNRRPDDTRGVLTRMGWILLFAAIAVAALLIALTPFGIAGLVLVALAAALGFVAQEVPARSAAGSGVLSGLAVLRGQLLTQPTNEMPVGREVDELSEVLPFAVVLGGADRWLDGVVATDDSTTDTDETDLSWYHGPAGWTLADLPDSLRNFVTVVRGVLLER